MYIGNWHFSPNYVTGIASAFSGRAARVTLVTRSTACAVVLVVGISGCTNIPPEAISVNETVTKGISTLRENGHALVTSWQETSLKFLDERWSKIYSKAELAYYKKHSISSKKALTRAQHKEVAGIAVLMRDKERNDITTQAAKYRQIISENAQQITVANNSITALLQSANQVIGARTALLTKAGELAPILADVSKVVQDSVAKHTEQPQ